MLDLALQFLNDEVTNYLAVRTVSSSATDKVHLSKLVDETGKVAFVENSIATSVLSIEEDRVFRSQLPEYEFRNGQHVVLQPDLKLNVYVIFAAYFQHYNEALKHLSYILTCFQSQSTFTPQTHPGLDARIPRLNLELQSLTFEQLNQMWAFIGGKLLPSVVYKVRMVMLQDEALSAVQPPVTAIGTEVHIQ